MKEGQASQTAILVCAARAAAQGRTGVKEFDDPTALQLLPDEARARVERFREEARVGERPKSFEHAMLEFRASMMIARTVAIDEAIRSAANPQLVLLGAGLDGRAWRMPELRDVTVFEVDHPDTQAAKKVRAARLTAQARDIRFVPVDFTKDRLDDALVASGHDAARPTTWIWEGVVMYLTREEIEKSLSVIAARSAKGSRLVILYHQRALMQLIVGMIVRRMGEPLRSTFDAASMRTLLTSFGFTVQSDEDLGTVGRRLSAELAAIAKRVRHNRLVVADRA